MIAVSDPVELMSVNFQVDATNVFNKVCTFIDGSTASNNAMKGIPNFTLDKFLNDMASLSSSWAQLTTTTTLFKRHFNLAEHHLYGSSRLGIKKYLPNQYAYNWTIGNTANTIDSSSIGVQQAWYNNTVNDFVQYNNTEYVAANNLDNTRWLSNRIIGMKNYEMTNHLGNVQATVLDKFTPRTKSATDTLYSLWHANLSMATDYYAFGSPMPGRATQDTVTQTFVATTPFSNTSVWVVDSVEANTSHFAWTAYGPTSNLTFVTTPVMQVKNNLGCPASPVSFVNPYGVRLAINNLQPNKNYKLYVKYTASLAEAFKLEQISPNAPFAPIAIQSTTSNNSTAVLNLSFTTGAASGPYYFHLVYRAQCNYVSIDSVMLLSDTSSTGYITTVLKEKSGVDDYRFGFNGQEKDNEIKGIGNSLAYETRIYDSRLGKWLSVDPLQAKYPSLSTYHFGANNPILYVDKDGREIYSYGEASNINKFVSQLQKGTSLKIEYNSKTHQISASGIPSNQYDALLLKASNDKNVNVNMYAHTDNFITGQNGEIYSTVGGSYAGSIDQSTISPVGKVNTVQYVNVNDIEMYDESNVESGGRITLHETLESYIGALENPGDVPNPQHGKDYNLKGYHNAHSKSLPLDVRSDVNHANGDLSVKNIDIRSKRKGNETGILRSGNPSRSVANYKKMFEENTKPVTPAHAPHSNDNSTSID